VTKLTSRSDAGQKRTAFIRGNSRPFFKIAVRPGTLLKAIQQPQRGWAQHAETLVLTRDSASHEQCFGHAEVAAVVTTSRLRRILETTGVPLSIYWRRSGNLFVTVAPHALIDAVRDALLVLPWR
jgi:hypothetical protein